MWDRGCGGGARMNLSHAIAVTHGTIATVTLRRPEKRNAMTLAMWVAMARVFGELGADPTVRAIVLAGEGDFCVGADIAEFGDARGDIEAAIRYEQAVDACSDAIASAPKPTIAAITGYCLGGGCHLAMACDFRVIAPDASVGIPAARLSIVYGVRGTDRLRALVGLSHAKRLLYTGTRIGAEEALAIGFADRLAANPIAEAVAFAGSMAGNAPLSIAGAKRILDGLALGDLDAAEAQRLIDAATGSDDHQEGRRAFAERRPPRFQGH